jgi:hypothetical protein
MKLSKFVKADKNILIEYIYDDGNNISDSYKILLNSKSNSYSYIAGSSSITGNTPGNQLFKIDGVTNNYGLVDTTNYSFLQLKDYASGFPVRHDTIKIHLPVNYTFGEYIGCYFRIFTFDYNNKITYELSNFFFDATNIDQSYLLNYTSPPLLYQEKLWGKNITINVPSTFAVSNQRVNGSTKVDTINFNLTNGTGLSLNAPIFIDFHFLTSRKTINSVTTYYLTAKTPISLPQTPEFEKLGVKIEHSANGDFFDIYGIYNDNIAEFNSFIVNSVFLGNRYYVTYTITLYEQNIRGKTFTITVTDNFNEKIEYRPIIKYSTTTAIIDVEMSVIDAVDNSSIFRKASYGMLQDEVAKYSLNLTKINIANAHKPKIYNVKSPEGAGIFGNTKVNNNVLKPQVVIETVSINSTVLADRFNVVAKSDNVQYGKDTFFGIGKLLLKIYPFDNVIQISIAQNVSNDQKNVDSGNGSKLEYVYKPEYMDMSNMGEIKLVIKNDKISSDFGLYLASNSVDLSTGKLVFKVTASKIADIRKIYDSGVNIFYITSKLDTNTTVVYSGLFNMYDSNNNVQSLNNAVAQIQSGLVNPSQPTIINDPNSVTKATAIVTRKIVSGNLPLSGTVSTANGASVKTPINSSTVQSQSTSLSASTKIGGVTYTINSDSSITIDGYTWQYSQLMSVLKSMNIITSNVKNLSIQTDSLYADGKLLGKLPSINLALQKEYITDSDKLQTHTLTVNNFKNGTSTGGKSTGRA